MSGLKREKNLIRTRRNNPDMTVLSYDAPISDDEDSRLLETIPDEGARDPEDTIVNEMINERIRKSVDELKEREKRVILPQSAAPVRSVWSLRT